MRQCPVTRPQHCRGAEQRQRQPVRHGQPAPDRRRQARRLPEHRQHGGGHAGHQRGQPAAQCPRHMQAKPARHRHVPPAAEGAGQHHAAQHCDHQRRADAGKGARGGIHCGHAPASSQQDRPGQQQDHGHGRRCLHRHRFTAEQANAQGGGHARAGRGHERRKQPRPRHGHAGHHWHHLEQRAHHDRQQHAQRQHMHRHQRQWRKAVRQAVGRTGGKQDARRGAKPRRRHQAAEHHRQARGAFIVEIGCLHASILPIKW
ncbi:hypothetical protein D9M69_26530 [compost metagenome]